MRQSASNDPNQSTVKEILLTTTLPELICVALCTVAKEPCPSIEPTCCDTGASCIKTLHPRLCICMRSFPGPKHPQIEHLVVGALAYWEFSRSALPPLLALFFLVHRHLSWRPLRQSRPCQMLVSLTHPKLPGARHHRKTETKSHPRSAGAHQDDS
eukprot:1391047-Rhodomonas_salina.1